MSIEGADRDNRDDLKNRGTFSGQDKLNNPSSNTEITKSNDEISVSDFGNINFGLVGQPSTELALQLSDKLEGNESIDGLLAQNEQIQLLLSEILSDYKSYIGADKEQLRAMIQQENLQIPVEQSQMIESMYEYMLQNDSVAGFEEFLVQNGINIIKSYLLTHRDERGNIKFVAENGNQLISKNEIKIRLKTGRFMNLYKGYREKHAEDSDTLDKLEQELTQLNAVTSFVKNSVDSKVRQYIEGKCSKTKLAENLRGLLTKAKDNEMLKGFINNKSKGSIDWLLRNSIKEYARLLNISDNNYKLESTSDNVFDIQLRSYLYLYGIISHSKEFNQGSGDSEIKFDPTNGFNDDELGEILKSILIADGIIKDNGKNKYLKSEQSRRKVQLEAEISRRKALAKRMEMKAREDIIGELPENGTLNVQTATGVELALRSQEETLGSKILGFDRKNVEIRNNSFFLKNLFDRTRENFLIEHGELLVNYIGPRDFRKFFSRGENGIRFNRDERNKFKNNWISNNPEGNLSELNEVENILQTFPYKYEENMNKAKTFMGEKLDNEHETIKNYAIGAVIDIIKDMFQNIVETNNTGLFMDGFKFDENNPAKIEDNCLLLSGNFNGEIMNIKYDLNTGKLYISSFINETTDKISIGNTEPNYEVGELEPFGNILDNFYSNPSDFMGSDTLNTIRPRRHRGNASMTGGAQGEDLSPEDMRKISEKKEKAKKMEREKVKEEHKMRFQEMCGTRLDEIGWKLKNQVETTTAQNSVLSDLLKTLGIVDIEGTIDLKGGDLYNIVGSINHTHDVTTLQSFSNRMAKLMPYLGLTRGNSSEQNKEMKGRSEIIFAQEGNNPQENLLLYLKNKSENFMTESQKFQDGKLKEVDEKSPTFGILSMIKELFVAGDGVEQKFDGILIENFELTFEKALGDFRAKKEEQQHNEIADLEASNADEYLEQNSDLWT